MIPRAEILCLVMAHGAAAACVERHLPLWQRAAGEVVVFSPWDDPLLPRDGTVVTHHHGISSRYGEENNHRTREALRYALCRSKSLTLLCEYDAVVWDQIPEAARPPAGGLSAARFTEPREWAGIRFAGSQYLHFPILIDRAALRPLVTQLDRLAPDAEGGYADRLIGFAAGLARLPVNDLLAKGLSFTRDTIEGGAVGRCRAAVAAGARFSHGIKTARTLDRILEVTPWK